MRGAATGSRTATPASRCWRSWWRWPSSPRRWWCCCRSSPTTCASTNHAKMTTAATFLARTKMVDLEDEILDHGFTDNDESEPGTFRDLGYPQFRWDTADRTDRAARRSWPEGARPGDGRRSQDAKDPMSMLTGFMGGMMSSFIDPIRIGLQESVRKVTVRMFWDEHRAARSDLRGGPVPDRSGQARRRAHERGGARRRQRGGRYRRRGSTAGPGPLGEPRWAR